MMGLTEEQVRQQEAETQQELDKRKAFVDTWVYRNREQIEKDDPSTRDGLEKEKLKHWKRQVIKVLSTAGQNLRLPQWAIAVAATLMHRFYSRRSMLRNDRFIVATACLHLAAKMEESPKHVSDVVHQCRRVFLGGKRTDAEARRRDDQEEIERFKDEVLAAERAILYTLNFDLAIQHPYKSLVKHCTELGLLHCSQVSSSTFVFKHLMQNTWNFINDSLRTTLSLQYPPEKVATGALYLANVINTRVHGATGDVTTLIHKNWSTNLAAAQQQGQMLEKTPDKPPSFFQYFNITTKEAEDISQQLMDLYEDHKLNPGQLAPAQATQPAAMNAPAEAGAHSQASVQTPIPV